MALRTLDKCRERQRQRAHKKQLKVKEGSMLRSAFIYLGNLVVHPCQRSALYSWQKLLCSQEKF